MPLAKTLRQVLIITSLTKGNYQSPQIFVKNYFPPTEREGGGHYGAHKKAKIKLEKQTANKVCSTNYGLSSKTTKALFLSHTVQLRTFQNVNPALRNYRAITFNFKAKRITNL